MAININKVFTSALGTAEGFVYLNKPDYGNEQLGFGNPRGVWKVDLTVDNKQAQPMIDAIVAVHEEAYEEARAAYEANPPTPARGKKPLLPYEGDFPFIDNGDGTTTFKFKCYASYTDKKTNENKPITVTIVDSRGKRITDLPIIGTGSKLKVKFKCIPYKWNASVGASVKLQLESVMLVKAETFSGGDEGWGDEVEEGGYVAQESKESRDEKQWSEPEGDTDDGDDTDGDF